MQTIDESWRVSEAEAMDFAESFTALQRALVDMGVATRAHLAELAAPPGATAHEHECRAMAVRSTGEALTARLAAMEAALADLRGRTRTAGRALVRCAKLDSGEGQDETESPAD